VASPEQVLAVIQILSDAYPERQLPKGAINIYINAFYDVPADYLERAAFACIQSSPWFPKVFDLRRQALKIARVQNFDVEPTDSGISLRIRRYKLQRDFANGEPLDESAWLKLIDDCERSGFTESAEDNVRRLAYYREYLAAHPDPEPDHDRDPELDHDEDLDLDLDQVPGLDLEFDPDRNREIDPDRDRNRDRDPDLDPKLDPNPAPSLFPIRVPP